MTPDRLEPPAPAIPVAEGCPESEEHADEPGGQAQDPRPADHRLQR